MTVLCVVQARTGSTRLPRKVLQDLDGRPMLAFLLHRLSTLDVDQLVVATSTLPADDDIVSCAMAVGVPVVRGPEHDVLARYAGALTEHPADHVVRLTADCPLTDPALVAEVLRLHLAAGADFTSNTHPRTFPKGLDVEVARSAALLDAARESTDPAEREHVMPFLYRRPERYRLANLRSGSDLGDERWTVDTIEDLERVRSIVASLDDPTASWQEILAITGTATPANGLRLRPATSSDGDVLRALRNDPAAVAASGTARPVDPAEHASWLARRLDDPATAIWIAELDGAPVGMARIDVRSAVGTVSVAVDPAVRGQGVGTAILAELVRRSAGDQQFVALEAEVRPENVASRRAFERNGFVALGRRGELELLRWHR